MEALRAAATAESRDKSRGVLAQNNPDIRGLFGRSCSRQRLLRRQIARSQWDDGSSGGGSGRYRFGVCPLPPSRGGPRLYKLFLLSPWVLFRLLIYRLPLITGLRLYSFRRRDEPIAHRLDANSVPLFLRRSHTFSAAPATIIIFPLPLLPPRLYPSPFVRLPRTFRLSVGARE